MKILNFLCSACIKPNKIYQLAKVCKNLEKSEVLRRLIPDKNKRKAFLKKQRIKFDSKAKESNILEGNFITIPYKYLNESNYSELYLDILHELTHCFQKEKYHINFKKLEEEIDYIDQWEELEAYALGLIEAKKIGMSKRQFRHYINGDTFLSKKQRKSLYKKVIEYRLK
jgi:hypothetical protein